MIKGLKDYHTSVLVREVMEGLNVKAGGKYIDATLGGGGHTEEILKRGGKVLGIDRDEEAINYVSEKLGRWIEDGKLRIEKTNFVNLIETAKKNNWKDINGILFDLGISSHQVDTASRGFAFRLEGPLDMRMDPTITVTAGDLVNALSEKELTRIFFRFGGEKKSRLFARAIAKARKEKRIETTQELVKIIEGIVRTRSKLHPATKVFMALRIAVNDELDTLKRALPSAAELLIKGGRLLVISFHEGEDRIVKNYFNDKEILKMINEKPTMAQTEEITANPRARSAKLRIAEKV